MFYGQNHTLDGEKNLPLLNTSLWLGFSVLIGLMILMMAPEVNIIFLEGAALFIGACICGALFSSWKSKNKSNFPSVTAFQANEKAVLRFTSDDNFLDCTI